MVMVQIPLYGSQHIGGGRLRGDVTGGKKGRLVGGPVVVVWCFLILGGDSGLKASRLNNKEEERERRY